MTLLIDAGAMTARLALEIPLLVPDGQGGGTTVWQEAATVWARLEPVSVRLGETAGAETGTVTHRIWLRHRDGLAPGQRLRKGNRLFAVKLVRDPDESGCYLLCHCEESV